MVQAAGEEKITLSVGRHRGKMEIMGVSEAGNRRGSRMSVKEEKHDQSSCKAYSAEAGVFIQQGND